MCSLSRLFAEMRCEEVERVHVPSPSQSCNLTDGDIGDHRVTPELVPSMNVGQVDFDNRQPRVRKRVSHRQSVVSQCARVDYDPVRSIGRPLDEVDDIPFVVRLEELNFDAKLRRPLTECLLDLGEGRHSVVTGITAAEVVQVRTVDYQELQSAPLPVPARGCASMYALRASVLVMCVYTWVVAGLAWPSNSCTTRRSAPPSKRCVANECLSV